MFGWWQKLRGGGADEVIAELEREIAAAAPFAHEAAAVTVGGVLDGLRTDAARLAGEIAERTARLVSTNLAIEAFELAEGRLNGAATADAPKAGKGRR